MISKVTIGSTFRGCCNYVMRKPGAIVLYSAGVRADNTLNATSDFDTIHNLRPTLTKAVLHISISFAYEDKENLTDEKRVAVAQAFLQKLELHDNQAICVKHTDAKHDHFHLIINRVGFDGNVAPDKFIKNRAARACDELETQFSLTVARGHGLGSEIKYRSHHQDQIKNEIKDAIRAGLANGAKNFEELGKYLMAENIEMRIQYQSTGRVNGLSFRKEEIAFKGSSIDKSFSYRKLGLQLQSGTNHIETIINQNKQTDYER